ncbi:MAG: BcpO-related WXXGXW repeat protein [Chlorobiaceae bacterium]|jgi:hypothetical protein|nr:BcpO-related WXXGXW repeat protein [Chlorobiaceae bacterium]
MKKNIWFAAGIAGMLLGQLPASAQADVNVQISSRNRPSFVIDRRPNFIELRDQGFSVSMGSPYDVIFYGNRYYLYENSRWYRSSSYRGPWVFIRSNNLPAKIRRHRWDDIKRYREVEYSKRDRRFDWYNRDQDNRDNNRFQRNDGNSNDRNRNDNDRNRNDNGGRPNDGARKN